MLDWLQHHSTPKLLAGLLLVSAAACGGGNAPVIVEPENRSAAESWPPPDSPFEERGPSSTEPVEMDEIAAPRPEAITRITLQLREMREMADLQEEDAQRSLLTAMEHAEKGEFKQAVEQAERALELAEIHGDGALSKRIACHLKLYRENLRRS